MEAPPSIRESPRPVSAHERIDLIDVVRGFAVFGVLLANLVWITTDVLLTDARLSRLPTASCFSSPTSSIRLFSILFGLRFAIQLSRADERRYSIVAVYARRVSILAAIGLLHISYSQCEHPCRLVLPESPRVGERHWPCKSRRLAAIREVEAQY